MNKIKEIEERQGHRIELDRSAASAEVELDEIVKARGLENLKEPERPLGTFRSSGGSGFCRRGISPGAIAVEGKLVKNLHPF